MKKYLYLVLLYLGQLHAQYTVGNGELSIDISPSGSLISSIKNNGLELLSGQQDSYFFELTLENPADHTITVLNSIIDWQTVTYDLNPDGTTLNIVFTQPIDINLPANLSVNVDISVHAKQSQWHISVNGLDNYSLDNVRFPILSFTDNNNGTFLSPYMGGKLYPSMQSQTFVYNGLYPRGWGATMPFMAYYNNQKGVYFGFHDPKASLKTMHAGSGNNLFEIYSDIPTPDKTNAGNNWDLSGIFELDLFDGDWYDAALIYKNWASQYAEYFPQNTPERLNRLHAIGDLGGWLYNYLSDYNGDMNTHESLITTALDFMETPIGIHQNNWNYYDFDTFYPDYFPERTGYDNLIQNVQQSGSVSVMPYINGRLYDTALSDYNTKGYPAATKDANANAYTQTISNGHVFAVECPTQSSFQDTLNYAAGQLANRLAVSGIYLDQIGAASPKQCMDPNHAHSLGGGHYWRDGYAQLLQNIHQSCPDTYLTTESGCDFIADQIEGFMVQGWMTPNQVPAFTVIYSGQNILFGRQTGTSQYGSQTYYGRLGQAFSFGFQPGRNSIFLVQNLQNASPEKTMAANFFKDLANFRYKLRSYMSYGEIKRPINLQGSIPEVNFDIFDFGTVYNINESAIQSSVWQSGDSIAVVLVNMTKPDVPNTSGSSINFSFDIDPASYGLTGNILIKEVTPNSETGFQNLTQNTIQSSLSCLEMKAYILKGEPAQIIESCTKHKINVFPIPAKNVLFINLPDNYKSSYKITVYDINGKKISLKTEHNKLNIKKLSKGVYFIKIKTKEHIYSQKFIKI